MKKLLVILLICLMPLKVNGDTIMIEMNSGRILYEDNAYSPKLIASITKVMTAIVAIESEAYTEEVIVGDEIDTIVCSCIYLQKGEQIAVQDLVYGLLMRSGNDAAMTLAKAVGGDVDSFVSMMNRKAKELGMTNSYFYNPSGLDEGNGNYSTAYDMALVTSYAMKNEEFRKIFSTKKYSTRSSSKKYTWINKNKLLFTYENTTGGKTGFTKKAGRTLITTASENNLDIVIVTIKIGDDFNTHKRLYQRYFEKYTYQQVLDENDVEENNKSFIDGKLYIEEEFYYPLLESEYELIKILYNFKNQMEYKDGDVVGNVEVFLGDEQIHYQDIFVSVEKVEESFIDKIKGFIDKLFD